VLLFEFFPLFVTFVGVVAAVFLFVADRRSRQDRTQDEPRPSRPSPRASARP